MAVNTSFINDNKTHDATEWARYFGKFITNGVFSSPANGLYVTKAEPYTLRVNPGTAFIDGVQIDNDANYMVQPLPTASVRLDRVVVRLDLSVPSGTIAILDGTDGTTTPPALSNTTTKKELCLAEVLIDPNGISAVGDTRADTALCGIVQNFLGPVDATGLFETYQDEFEKVSAEMRASVEDLEDQAQTAFAGFLGGATSNAIINGDFTIDQRGQGAEHVCGLGQKYTVDRWLYRIDGVLTAPHKVKRVLLGTTGAPSTALEVKTSVLGANSMSGVGQFIERGVEVFQGGKVTVALKMRANAAQKAAVNVQVRHDASTVTNLEAPAFDITTAWQTYHVTFDVPMALRDAAVESFKVTVFTNWSGSSANDRFQTATDNNVANTVYLAEVVACKGDVPMPFYPLGAAESARACERYYRKRGTTTLGAGVMKADKTVKTQSLDFFGMRAAPVMTVTDRLGSIGKASWEVTTSGIENNHTASPTSDSDGVSVCWVVQPLNSSTQVQAASIIFGSIEADAELYS